MTTVLNKNDRIREQATPGAASKSKKPSTKQPITVPISIKPVSSLPLGALISCLSGMGLAMTLGTLLNLGHFGKFIAAGAAIIVFVSGLKIVPTFHRGVIILLGHRLPRFILAEGCHWLLPKIYRLKSVPIAREVLNLDGFEVLTSGDPSESAEFTNVKLSAVVQWQVIDPVKFLETQPEVLEKLLVLLATESIRMVALREGSNYSSIVRTVGKSLSNDAVPMACAKVAALGVMIHDIIFTKVKRADEPPGNTQVFVKSAGIGADGGVPIHDPWAATGLI